MESVTITLERYEKMVEDYRELQAEMELLKSDFEKRIADLKEEINLLSENNSKMKNYLMEDNLLKFNFDSYNLDKLIDPDGYSFGINYKEELNSMGISYEEQIEFIKTKYAEWQGSAE